MRGLPLRRLPAHLHPSLHPRRPDDQTEHLPPLPDQPGGRKRRSVRRLLDRGKTSGRSDDNEAVIRNRLREYKEKTLPVLNFYRDKGICHDVDGTGTVEEVGRQSAGSSPTS